MLEYDTPQALLANSSSHFSSLVEQAGVAEAEHLRALAKASSMKPRSNLVNADEMQFDGSEYDPLILS